MWPHHPIRHGVGSTACWVLALVLGACTTREEGPTTPQDAGAVASSNGSSAPATTSFGNQGTSVAAASSSRWIAGSSSMPGSSSAGQAPGTSSGPPQSSSQVTADPTALDPWKGSGIWLPPGTTNLWVVDQSNNAPDGPNGVGGMDYVPGCLQYQYAASSSDTCFTDTLTGMTTTNTQTTFTAVPGHVIAIRFDGAPSTNPLARFAAWGPSGGGLNGPLHMWLSSSVIETYAAAQARNAGCAVEGPGTPMIMTNAGNTNGVPLCVVGTGRYYLKMEFTQAPCGGGCRTQVEESPDTQ